MEDSRDLQLYRDINEIWQKSHSIGQAAEEVVEYYIAKGGRVSDRMKFFDDVFDFFCDHFEGHYDAHEMVALLWRFIEGRLKMSKEDR